jgi:hypothetical protein
VDLEGRRFIEKNKAAIGDAYLRIADFLNSRSSLGSFCYLLE